MSKKKNKNIKKILKSFNKLNYRTISIVLIVVLLLSVFTSGFSLNGFSKNKVADNTVEFINNELLNGQGTASSGGITFEHGLYKLILDIDGRETETYVSTDGSLLFTQVIEISDGEEDSASSNVPAASNIPKTEKPEVELFVMSHCPYGTQAEKGMLPVVEQLGDTIDFKIKFVYYAMHGETELDEQMNQVCIMQEEPDKYNDYLACFLEEGDGEGCLNEMGINMANLMNCVASLDSEFSVSKNYEDENTWLSGRYPLFDIHKADNEKYGIGGSPSLVINGQSVSSGRSSAAYLANICAGFEVAPEECDVELSSDSPSPGFGYSGSGSNTAADCGV